MKLIIHRGTHEIGGSCVEISTATTRIVLDVGMPLVDAAREPFNSFSIRGKTVAELLSCGVLPKVRGLFEEAPGPQAILLSHAHLDHVGLLQHSRPEIPVYASKGTSKMMLAGALFAGRNELPRERHREIRSGVPFQVGDIRVTPFSVDHSIFDSVAFQVETEGRSLLYSGDIRTHGRKPLLTKNLVSEATRRRIDVLLMEGTHLGGDSLTGITEPDLEETILPLIQGAPGIVLAAFSPMDVDRLVTLYKATRRANRTFVVDVYAAFILHLVASQANISSPVAEQGIRVYYHQTFASTYVKRRMETIAKKFAGDRITLEEVLANPSSHVMTFRPSMVNLDFGGRLPEKSRCLYSYWKGYLKNPDWVDLQERIRTAGGDFLHAHTSGHIFINDLIEFVKAIGPRCIVPIHTFEPQEFLRHFPNVRILNDGEQFSPS